MDLRYAQPDLTLIWDLRQKLKNWQVWELAVIKAREDLGKIPKGTYQIISEKLSQHEIDLDVYHKLDDELGHDMNAAVEERRRWLPPALQGYYHEVVTSYDIEDGPLAMTIESSVVIFEHCLNDFEAIATEMARTNRTMITMDFTHGQFADIGSAGLIFLTALRNIIAARETLDYVKQALVFAKMSGGTGRYATIDPQEEALIMEIMGREAFIGATQILPRILWVPIAQTLANIVLQIDKLAIDIRLSARSGLTTMREGFGMRQKGSSTYPHKRNPIKTEQLDGMARMAVGYSHMIEPSILTWEKRSIEMSSVERIAWPDLFHVAVYSVRSITKILQKLEIYPDTMMELVVLSAGTYAASRANSFLYDLLKDENLQADEIYRITQLASFNALEAQGLRAEIRANPPKTIAEWEEKCDQLAKSPRMWPQSIQDIIAGGLLKPSPSLDLDQDWIDKVNEILIHKFSSVEVQLGWVKVFSVREILKGEDFLYEQILGDASLPE